ncbi:SGNH/GDSL hydrolase family protein [Streptomyces sp. NBC_01264]|uniref:SGNH/GDSL hydrolase family protein n=1 Tax=Streptomyces sp. NBC_01264 TaxID=2903804 RepID=UPI00225C32B2|nr:SGNH/GDSL hydrolase family protein [Streptomyces sp. NBC_01264]MCX4778793.1 SGNH/GDSL hydrolase family protein [Streptomyces sp. NBC_01264]
MNRRSAVFAGVAGLAGLAVAVPLLTTASEEVPASMAPSFPKASPDASPGASSDTGSPRTLRVMPLGASTTAGVGSTDFGGYRLPLGRLVAGQSKYAIDFVGSRSQGPMEDNQHEGHPGYTVGRIRAGVDRWIAAAKPDVVLLHIGLNNLNRGGDPDRAADEAEELVDRIFTLRPGVTVVMQGLVPSTPGSKGQDISEPIAVYNRRLKRIETREQGEGKHFRFAKAPWLTPAERADATTPAELADGLHPNDTGYAKVADAFFEAMEQAHSDGWFRM